MNIQVNIIGMSVFFLFLTTILGVFFFFKKKYFFLSILKTSFLLITLPKKISELDEKQETFKDFREMIAAMEQLLSSLKSMYSQKITKKLFWQDYFWFEYIAHEWQIMFYVICPYDYIQMVEKQIHAFYPDAIVERTEEINIFKGKKYVVWTYAYLSKKFFYPIKTYQKLETDPINAITNALSKLSDDESACIQILLKPIDDDWQEYCHEASSMILQGKKKIRFSFNIFAFLIDVIQMLFFENQNKDGTNPDSKTNTPISALTQERAKIVDEKGQKTGYETIIRIVVAGNEQASLKQELLNIISAFKQFSYPEFNSFSFTWYHNTPFLVKNFIYRSFRHPLLLLFRKNILNTEEIASIFHFPHIKYNKTPEIKWQNFKIVKAPIEIPKEGILLWYNIYRWITKEIRMLNEDRFCHFYVIGQTGTWKSSILQVMARQDFKNGKWVAIIDPHGDLVKDLIPFIPRSRADDIIIFNPIDTQRPLGLNLLESSSPEEMELIATEALNIMIRIFWNEIFWPRIQDYFRNGVLTLMEYPYGGTLVDIVRLFTDDAFQKERVRYVRNAMVKSWWTSTYAAMGEREKQEMIPYFAAKFWAFITNGYIRNIIGQVKSSFDIFDVMNQSKILLVNLSKWSLWQENSELLGLILIAKIQMAAMRRNKIPKSERKDFFLYIDEFQNYVTQSIENILAEARKYRLWLIVAHQYLWQLEKSDPLTKSSTNLKNAIFGNVKTIMCYKIGPEDAEFLEKYYSPVFSRQDLINLDKFKAVIKLSVNDQPVWPFSITPVNPYLEKWDESVSQAYYELSRLKYGRDKNFVEREINYRMGIV